MDNKILPFEQRVIFEPHKMNQRLPFIFHTDSPSPRAASNIHENPELLCFLQGSGRVRCGGEELRVQAGDVTVIDSFLLHEVIADEPIRYHCLIIDRDFCALNGADLKTLRFAPHICDGELTDLFDRLASEYERKDAFYLTAIRATVMEMLLLLCRRYSAPRQYSVEETGAPNDNVYSALKYICHNLHRKLSLEEIAAHTGLSKYYFCREFKRMTCLTPVQYINQARCESASNLLGAGQYTVKEVAVMVGFDNFSYFSSVFKKYTGLLPSEYMKNFI